MAWFLSKNLSLAFLLQQKQSSEKESHGPNYNWTPRDSFYLNNQYNRAQLDKEHVSQMFQYVWSLKKWVNLDYHVLFITSRYNYGIMEVEMYLIYLIKPQTQSF